MQRLGVGRRAVKPLGKQGAVSGAEQCACTVGRCDEQLFDTALRIGYPVHIARLLKV